MTLTRIAELLADYAEELQDKGVGRTADSILFEVETALEHLDNALSYIEEAA